MCLYYVGKVSDSFSKSSGTSCSPCMHYLSTNKTLIKKLRVKEWLSSKRCHFVKKYFHGIKLLRVNVQCVYIAYAKYQMASVKAVVQVDFSVHVLSEH